MRCRTLARLQVEVIGVRLSRLCIAALLMFGCAAGDPQSQDTTTVAGVLSGSASTPERCAAMMTAVWVVVAGTTEEIIRRVAQQKG